MESKGLVETYTCEFKEGAYLSVGKDLSTGKFLVVLRGEGNRFFATNLDDVDLQVARGEITLITRKENTKSYVIYTLKNIDVSIE